MNIISNLTESIYSLMWSIGTYEISVWSVFFFFSLSNLSFAGYLGSNMKNVVIDAAKGPVREAKNQGIDITEVEAETLRDV